jgi:hypothetical protein
VRDNHASKIYVRQNSDSIKSEQITPHFKKEVEVEMEAEEGDESPFFNKD